MPAGLRMPSARPKIDSETDIVNFLAARDAGEARAKDMADKVWQSSRSSRKKRDNLETDMHHIFQAMQKCWCQRGDKEEERWMW